MGILEEILAFVFGTNFNNNVLQFLYLTRANSELDYDTLHIAGFNMDSIINLSSSITSVILPIADCLLIMYFVFNLIEMASNETFTLQTFGRQLGKFVVFHILIVNTFALMLVVLDLGTALIYDTNGIINSFNGSLTGTSTINSVFLGDVTIMDGASDIHNEMSTLKTQLDGMGFIKQITSGKLIDYMGKLIYYDILLFLPFIVSVVCYCSIILAALTRILQFAIRIPLMPIAISDMYNGGIHSRGMTTLKSMIALAAQGMVILIIVAIGNTLSTTMYANAVNPFMASLYISIVKLAQISLLGKSLDVTKEMIGA